MLEKSRAVVRQNYCAHNSLRVVNLPNKKPAHGEMLVRVHAATVNRTDCAIVTGTPFFFRFFLGLFRPRLTTTGTDFAGEVMARGEGASYKVGDRVFGFHDLGASSHADEVVIGERVHVQKIPDGIDFVVAAAALEGAHYALGFLRHIELAENARVFVNGGTGAIGSALIQFLVAQGHCVVATAPTDSVERVKALGVQTVIDYEHEDFARVLEGDFDAVFDAVGQSTFGHCKHLLKPAGIYLSSELGPYGQNVFLSLWTLLKRQKARLAIPGDVKASLSKIFAALAEGTFRPMIDRTYRVEEVCDAFSYADSGQKRGNVILAFTPEANSGD